jgi:hypothetical protein
MTIAIRNTHPPADGCPECGDGPVYLHEAYGVCADCAAFYLGADDPDYSSSSCVESVNGSCAWCDALHAWCDQQEAQSLPTRRMTQKGTPR